MVWDNDNYRDCRLGCLLLMILESLKEKIIGLEQSIDNLRHSESHRPCMASFMQSLNIYGYRALCRKSDPRFNFKCERNTKETKYVALRDLIYLV